MSDPESGETIAPFDLESVAFRRRHDLPSSCVLLWARLSDGSFVADGKTWTGYPDSEEHILNESIGMTVNQYAIETEAAKNPNTTFESGAPYEQFAIRDGRLVTGQQQHSTRLFAELVLEALADA